MAFEAVLGQDAAIRFLRRVAAHERLPGAFLFLGPHHVGKRLTALTFAKALNCENPPPAGADGVDSCDRCPSCRKVDADLHPDIITIAPDGQFIKIDQIRAVGEQLALNPLLARKRVVIVTEAERMNPQAANAFLKTLEEPPADTMLVLCVEDAAQVLPTIVSRCVPVRFQPLAPAVLRRLLAEQEAAGTPLEPGAEDFAVRFCQGRMPPDLRAKLAGWLAIRDDLLQALRFPETALAAGLGEKLARWSQSGEWSFVLEWLETWFRDVALAGAGAGAAHLINVDRQDDLRAAASRLDPEAAAQCHRAVLAARNDLELNANKPLALEALWLQFRQHRRTAQGGVSP